MGVDFLTCKSCGYNFADCGDFVSCECGEHWCDEECAEADGVQRESCKLGKDIDDNDCDIPCYGCKNLVESSCQFCRGEDFGDDVLLDLALNLLHKTRMELVEIYKSL